MKMKTIIDVLEPGSAIDDPQPSLPPGVQGLRLIKHYCIDDNVDKYRLVAFCRNGDKYVATIAWQKALEGARAPMSLVLSPEIGLDCPDDGTIYRCQQEVEMLRTRLAQADSLLAKAVELATGVQK